MDWNVLWELIMYGRNAFKTLKAWLQWITKTTKGNAWFKPPY